MRLALVLALLAGCGAMPAPVVQLDGGTAVDATPPAGDLAGFPSGTASAPSGFGATCSMSNDCAGYPNDAPPGRLGCYAYLGVSYCSRPCGAGQPACWSGSTCTCVNRVNVSGYPETDCYCAR